MSVLHACLRARGHRKQVMRPGDHPSPTCYGGGLPQVRVDFWILWSALLVGMGAGFTMLNNLSQMVESLGGGAPPGPSPCARGGCRLQRGAPHDPRATSRAGSAPGPTWAGATSLRCGGAAVGALHWARAAELSAAVAACQGGRGRGCTCCCSRR